MRILRFALMLVVIGLGTAAAWRYWPIQRPQIDVFQGYVEGDLVFVAAEEGGRIEQLFPTEGDGVTGGQPIAILDATLQEARRAESAAKLEQARSTLSNLRAAQQRPEQIAVLQAQEDRARASLDFSTREFERQTNLSARGFATAAALDQAKSAFERDTAALAEARRQIEAARLAARTEEIGGAEAAVEAAAASLAQAEAMIARRNLSAPAPADVQDIFFRKGEVVVAGQPILSLLPEGSLKVRFYVPEPRLSGLALGQTVDVNCDGCKSPIVASLSFISSQAEYTPPVIFSQTERAKLVFRVEARIEVGPRLPIGLPVDVSFKADSASSKG